MTIKSCALLIYVMLHMTFITKSHSKTTYLLVSSLTRVRLRTSEPLKSHPRWELLDGTRINAKMECYCYWWMLHASRATSLFHFPPLLG